MGGEERRWHRLTDRGSSLSSASVRKVWTRMPRRHGMFCIIRAKDLLKLLFIITRYVYPFRVLFSIFNISRLYNCNCVYEFLLNRVLIHSSTSCTLIIITTFLSQNLIYRKHEYIWVIIYRISSLIVIYVNIRLQQIRVRRNDACTYMRRTTCPRSSRAMTGDDKRSRCS